MEDDYKWFLEKFEELYNEYGESYIVIKNKKVLGVYKTYAEGVRTTETTEKLGTFIVQKCDRDESAYTNYRLN